MLFFILKFKLRLVNNLCESKEKRDFIRGRRYSMERVVKKAVILGIIGVLCVGTVGVTSISAASQPKTSVKTTR